MFEEWFPTKYVENDTLLCIRWLIRYQICGDWFFTQYAENDNVLCVRLLVFYWMCENWCSMDLYQVCGEWYSTVCPMIASLRSDRWLIINHLSGNGLFITSLCRPRWLSWMRVRLETRRSRVRPPPRAATFVKYFLQSFSPFHWFKKGSCQFLTKKWAAILVNRLED